jgi:hypothetical protein
MICGPRPDASAFADVRFWYHRWIIRSGRRQAVVSMKRLAYVLLLMGSVWIAGALTYSFSSVGIYVPGWIPLSMILPSLVVFAVVLNLGWIAPMVVGIWLLVKRH